MFEFDTQTQKSLRVFFLIFAVFVIGIIAKEYYFGYDESVENILKKEYIKKVDSVYVNKKEHNFKYVAYSNGQIESLDFSYNKNDSLVKKKYDSIEYVYRNGEVLQNNLLVILRHYFKK